MSQDRVRMTFSTEELFLCTQYMYIALPTYQAGKIREGGWIWTGQHGTIGVPARPHTSQLNLTMVSRAFYKTGSFYTIIL